MDLLGPGYLADSIAASARARAEVEAYCVYETDCLYSIGSALGVKFRRRYYDLLHPEPEDDRTGMEIAQERLARLGIKVVE